MNIYGIQIIAGIASTVLFVCCKIPMLLKVLKTKDLNSYSPIHLGMSMFGNLTYWFYVISLPFGPVWILQGFYTTADILMVSLYLLFQVYQKNISSSSRQILVRKPVKLTTPCPEGNSLVNIDNNC
jgi:uncharacterized protein with PQ loop repeat